MKTQLVSQLAAIVIIALSITAGVRAQQQQQLASKYDRERGQQMLKMICDDIKNKYYDPTLRGMDLNAKFTAANERLKTASSNGQIMGIIAQLMVELNDSHTFFLPPSRSARTEYGWQAEMIGDHPFVTAVKPKSDAESKGLKVGDEVLTIDSFRVTRDDLWLMKYYYYTLRPQPGMKLTVRHPDGKQEDLIVLAKVTEHKRVMDLTGGGGGMDLWDYIREGQNEDYLRRHRFSKIGDDVFIWKMPEFDLTESQVDDMIDKASKCKSLVIDLRRNGGGAVTTLNRLVGNLFDHEVKIADWKGRKKFDPQVAKPRGKGFNGQVIVLIDSESGSAAEIFARVMQIEKRGTVIGDRSSGKVMVSRIYEHESGLDTVAFYASSVTEADLIMTDGKSLENVGVIPDRLLLPTAQDLASGIDPVLSAAVALAGGKLDPAEAGKLFPIEWPK